MLHGDNDPLGAGHEILASRLRALTDLGDRERTGRSYPFRRGSDIVSVRKACGDAFDGYSNAVGAVCAPLATRKQTDAVD
jgi:hypothetical protein